RGQHVADIVRGDEADPGRGGTYRCARQAGRELIPGEVAPEIRPPADSPTAGGRRRPGTGWGSARRGGQPRIICASLDFLARTRRALMRPSARAREPLDAPPIPARPFTEASGSYATPTKGNQTIVHAPVPTGASDHGAQRGARWLAHRSRGGLLRLGSG